MIRYLVTTIALALNFAATAAPTTTQVHVLQCGEVNVLEMGVFSDRGEYDGQQGQLGVTCYLIRHPKGDLLWDTGLPDALAAQADGMTNGAFNVKVPRTLGSQLEELNLTPDDIEYLALSHSHFDHSGNANAFAKSTWISDPAEREWMFSPERMEAGQGGENYTALREAKTIDVTDDYDVFGDGIVTVIRTPGHTPGHLALLVRLADTTLLLFGDLYHMRENRTHRRVPKFNVDRELTLQSMDKFEALAKETGARVIVQHDIRDIATLPAFDEPLQ